MITFRALAVVATLGLLAQPVKADQCTSQEQMVGLRNCLAGAADTAGKKRCMAQWTAGWGLGAVWCGMLSGAYDTPTAQRQPAPSSATQCPTRAGMIGFVRCLRAAEGERGGYRCAEVYRWDRTKMECLESSGITAADVDERGPISKYQNEPRAAAPPRAAALGCGPQLTVVMAQRIDAANPAADPAVKYMALRKALELMGCVPPQPPTPAQQTTTCIPLGGGMFTCTTQ